jgi:catechol 2,3-dioxygenase-like lactoylglutathione lyase family enzyme
VSESLKSVGAITLFVDDPKQSKGFYARVFRASTVYEDDDSVAFEFENLLVNLLRAPAANELIEPAAVAPREAGARFQLTIWVEDADAVCDQLSAAGVELLNGPQDREWGMRTAAFADPDGHVWEVAARIG